MGNKQLLAACTLIACTAVHTLFAGDTLVEGKAAYFRPTQETFEKVYGSGGIYGIEITSQLWRSLYIWGSGDIFQKGGKALGEGERPSTTITLVPVSLGLKYLARFEHFDFYLGASPTYAWVHFHDKSEFVIEKSAKWAWGGTAKTGFLFNLRKHFFLDIFGSYTYLNTRFHDTRHNKLLRPNMDLSNWTVGAGLGLRFGKPRSTRKSEARPVEEKKEGFLKRNRLMRSHNTPARVS